MLLAGSRVRIARPVSVSVSTAPIPPAPPPGPMLLRPSGLSSHLRWPEGNTARVGPPWRPPSGRTVHGFCDSSPGGAMNTRTIAIAALVIAVIVVLILVL